jgi:formate hydrogenlyase transcriptional activator
MNALERRAILQQRAEITRQSIPQSSRDTHRAEDYENLLRFMRQLNLNQTPRQLLQELPSKLCNLIPVNTLAIASYDQCQSLSWFGANHEGLSIPLNIGRCEESPWSWVYEQQKLLLIPCFDREVRFSSAIDPFREYGNQSLCILPLSTSVHRLGTVCVGRRSADAFSEKEISLLTSAVDYAALALDNKLNFASSENMRAQLENEQIKLKLILDLNNSVVSNLELKDVLLSISPSIRRVMRLDGVALILPDEENKNLQLYALDFPGGKGVIQQNKTSPFNGSLPGQVFRSGKAWVGDIAELRSLGFDHSIASQEGVETLCMLPLTRCERVLGVLCLVRMQRNAFTGEDVEFLSQIAGQVAIAIDNALAYREITELKDKLTQEKLYLEDEIRSEMNFEEIVGNSAVLRRVLRQVEVVAPTESTVLIYGDTGTGKELIARAVHNLSQRQSNAFVKLNCAAIPTGLLESELFGHEKGAFTGAIAQRIGRFELASQGTMFLDEVGEIPLDLQPKLLRVLQEREFERLGGSRTFHSDARLIAATNRDLSAMVEEQRFRSDLFYRLNVFPIHVPPLRERAEDIPFLVRHFVQTFARNMKKRIDTISSDTMSALVRYPWPGNIRELQNVIERAVILSQGPVLKVPLADLKPKMTGNGTSNVMETLEEVERKHILSVLEQTGWVFAGPNGAAARLGLKRTTLQFRMQKLGISRPPKSQS